MEPPKDQGITRRAEGDVLPVVFSGPAPYANKIFLSITAEGLARVSFLEFPIGAPPGVTPQFRGAVLLSAGDLWSLKLLIEDMMKPSEPSEAGTDGK
jgi:hypothetical protein